MNKYNKFLRIVCVIATTFNVVARVFAVTVLHEKPIPLLVGFIPYLLAIVILFILTRELLPASIKVTESFLKTPLKDFVGPLNPQYFTEVDPVNVFKIDTGIKTK